MKKKRLLLTAVATLGLTATTMAQVPSYVPTNGLVGWWPFNGNANDESGNGNNGTINGSMFTSDHSGNSNAALNQTQNGSYVRTQSVISNCANNFTISLWVNPSQIDTIKTQGITGGEGTGVMSIIHPSHGSNWGSQSNNAGVGINIGTNQIQIVEHTHLFIASPLVYSTQLTGWHHVVLVYDQHVPKLFIDGNLVATGLQSNIQSVHPSSGFCTVYNQSGFGSSFTPNGNPIGNFKGKFDDIGIWNRPLTNQEIVTLIGCSTSFNTQPNNQTININNNAQFIVGSSDLSATYQWQTDLGVGFQNLNSVGQYSGTTNDTLTIANVTMSNNNQPFRCVISSGSCSDTSNVAVLTVNNNVGINEFAQDNLFSIYPNPAQTVINVKADSKLVGEQYTIIDNSGRTVLYGKILAEITSIELGNLSNGVYLFNVSNNMNQQFKILKH
jgi:hypothetical protein